MADPGAHWNTPVRSGYQDCVCRQVGFPESSRETCPLNPGKMDAVMNVPGGLAMREHSGKTGFRILSYVALSLAAAGVALPLLPTTPFVLLAAFFASKGSPAFAQWLDEHPRYGPIIDSWRRKRAVPVPAKLLACSMMTLSWSMLALLGVSGMILAVSGTFMVVSACYLVTRPSF